MTAQEQADSLMVEYLAWAEKKYAQDQKRLKSILEAWGFRATERR
jgi:hypothetical protein